MTAEVCMCVCHLVSMEFHLGQLKLYLYAFNISGIFYKSDVLWFPNCGIQWKFYIKHIQMENYTKLRVIGKGSYGEVWLVKHKRDRKQVGI